MSCRVTLVGLGQIQHLLGDKAEDELFGDGGDARHGHFAQQALDVIFLGIAEATVGQDRLQA